MDVEAYKVHINAFKCLSAHILSHTHTHPGILHTQIHSSHAHTHTNKHTHTHKRTHTHTGTYASVLATL